jgi:hypothetical protein
MAPHELVFRRVFPLLLTTVLGCSEGGAARGEDPTEALRALFSARAAEVLETGDGFQDAGEGWVASVPAVGLSRSVTLVFPRDANEPFTLRGADGAVVEVRELGAAGPVELASNSLVFPRGDGGATFYTAAPQGLESWTYVPAGRAEVRLSWRVSAPLENEGSHVAVLGADGAALFAITAPRAVTASGRELVPQLEATGELLTVVVRAGGEAVLIDPLWSAAGAMVAIRGAHTATLLGSGAVLAAGGRNGVSPHASSELFAPATGTWKQSGGFSVKRAAHTATLLTSGKVLVAGGHDGGGALAQVDIFDPATGLFTAGPALQKNRYEHSATRLNDGRVLAVGGFDVGNSALTHAEIYDPLAGSWKPAAFLSTGRARHAATLLPSGQVLVSGGRGAGGTSLSSAEIYDPSLDKWLPGGTLPGGGRESHQGLLVGGKTVLLIAGLDQISSGNGQLLGSTERYDTAAGTWSFGGSLAQARFRHDAVVLPNGKVLTAGGDTGALTPSAELYDPATDKWSSASAMTVPRSFHTLTVLQDGRVLASGGDPNGSTSELYAAAALGALCSLDAECASGSCADGVCCTTACSGSCLSCLFADTGAADGTCAPVAAGLDPAAECVDLGAASCSTNGSCDGAGQCALYADGSVCLAPYCDAPTSLTLTSTCSGGLCSGSGAISCAPFLCLAGACASLCVTDADCDPSTYCDQGTCAGKAIDGAPCAANAACFSGACADSVCCDDVCAGPCDACSVAAGGQADGQCTPATNTPCDDGDACTEVDTCQAGACVGASPVVCQPAGPCREAGTCDAATGACDSPVKQDGAPCATAASEPGTCFAGDCVADPEASGANGSSGSGSTGSSGAGGEGAGSSASGTGAGAGAETSAGASSDGEDPSLRGAGCAMGRGAEAPSARLAWLLLPLLGLARRRRATVLETKRP